MQSNSNFEDGNARRSNYQNNQGANSNTEQLSRNNSYNRGQGGANTSNNRDDLNMYSGNSYRNPYGMGYGGQ